MPKELSQLLGIPEDLIETMKELGIEAVWEPADYEELAGADIGILFKGPGQPEAIVPVSKRAEELFEKWGWTSSYFGIRPPENPTLLFQSVPTHWITRVTDVKLGPHIITEITLPGKLIVVH